MTSEVRPVVSVTADAMVVVAAEPDAVDVTVVAAAVVVTVVAEVVVDTDVVVDNAVVEDVVKARALVIRVGLLSFPEMRYQTFELLAKLTLLITTFN